MWTFIIWICHWKNVSFWLDCRIKFLVSYYCVYLNQCNCEIHWPNFVEENNQLQMIFNLTDNNFVHVSKNGTKLNLTCEISPALRIDWNWEIYCTGCTAPDFVEENNQMHFRFRLSTWFFNAFREDNFQDSNFRFRIKS